MIGSNSKINLWGCTICYHRQRKEGEYFCSLAQRTINTLKFCPLGVETNFVDSMV